MEDLSWFDICVRLLFLVMFGMIVLFAIPHFDHFFNSDYIEYSYDNDTLQYNITFNNETFVLNEENNAMFHYMQYRFYDSQFFSAMSMMLIIMGMFVYGWFGFGPDACNYCYDAYVKSKFKVHLVGVASWFIVWFIPMAMLVRAFTGLGIPFAIMFYAYAGIVTWCLGAMIFAKLEHKSYDKWKKKEVK